MVKLDKNPANAHHLWDKVMLSYNKMSLNIPNKFVFLRTKALPYQINRDEWRNVAIIVDTY